MKNYFIAISLLIMLNSVAYASSYPKNLEGFYECNGTEVDTKEGFTCTMTMQKTNQTYAIKSNCNDNTSYVGTGIYDQEKHVLALVFVNPKKAEETGVVIADVKQNNELHSTWTYLQKTTVAHGFCTKRKA